MGTDEVPEASPEISRLLAGVPAISTLASTLVSSKLIVDRTHLWERLVAAWVGLCKPVGTIRSIDAEVATADDYTIRRYRDSDQLDLEYISQSASDEEVDD